MPNKIIMGVMVFVLAPTIAFARPYLGLSVQQADYDETYSEVGFSYSVAMDDTGLGVILGYEFDAMASVNHAVELSWFTLDLSGSVRAINASVPLTLNMSGDLDVTSLSYLLKAKNMRLVPYLRLAYGDFDFGQYNVQRFNISGEDDSNFYWGLGAEFNVSDNSRIRAEYTDFNVDGADFKGWSVALTYAF